MSGTLAFDDKYGPAIVVAEQAAGRHLQNIVFLPQDKSRLNMVTVAETQPFISRRGELGYHQHPLFLHPQGGDFGKPGRFDAPHNALQGMIATPAVKQYLHAWFDLHRIGGEYIHFHFQCRRITHFQ